MILHVFALFSNFNNMRAFSVSGSHTLAEVATSFPSWDSSSSWGSCPWETSSSGGPQTYICAICIHLQHVLPTSTA
jgi:hypothetical protein